MREAEYRKVRPGAKVRTKVVLTSRSIEIPAGTVMEVRYKRSGFDLAGPTCPYCGVRPFIAKVPAYEVDLVEQEDG